MLKQWKKLLSKNIIIKVKLKFNNKMNTNL